VAGHPALTAVSAGATASFWGNRAAEASSFWASDTASEGISYLAKLTLNAEAELLANSKRLRAANMET
jgi:hypothetical protein